MGGPIRRGDPGVGPESVGMLDGARRRSLVAQAVYSLQALLPEATLLACGQLTDSDSSRSPPLWREATESDRPASDTSRRRRFVRRSGSPWTRETSVTKSSGAGTCRIPVLCWLSERTGTPESSTGTTLNRVPARCDIGSTKPNRESAHSAPSLRGTAPHRPTSALRRECHKSHRRRCISLYSPPRILISSL